MMASKMYDSQMFSAAGLPSSLKYSNSIDQNGLPIRPDMQKGNLKYESIVDIMKLQDLREYVNRYQWSNIPKGLNHELIERILYFRGKALLYFNENVNKFQFLPFALNKTIDEYGRYTNCNTLPFIGVSQDANGVDYVKQNISIVYDDLFTQMDFKDPEAMTEVMKEWESGEDKGIIINDSVLALSQQPSIRAGLVQPIIASMATCYQIINTAMFACADYNLIQAQNEAEYETLIQQLSSVNQRILKGDRYGAVIGTLNLASLKTSNASGLQDLWETYNSLDNLRKSTAGISNSGVFNKKERMLQSEQQLNGSNADDIYMEGLWQRQRACDLFNQYYGGNMWVMSKETPTPVEQLRDGAGTGDDYGTSYHEGTTPHQIEGGE